MPSKDKNKKYWVGQVKRVLEGTIYSGLLEFQGWKRLRKNTYQYRKVKKGFKTKTAAAAWEKDHWQEIIQTQVDPEITIHTTFSQVSGMYLDNVKARAVGENTYQYKRKLIQNFITFIGCDPVLPVPTIVIEQFLNHEFKQKGGKKANRSLRELGTVFNWMFNRQLIDLDPTMPIDPFPEIAFRKYVPPAEDLKKVIRVANDFEQDIIRTAYHTLARSGEIRNLKISDCDFSNNKVTLYTRKRSGGCLEGDKIDMDKTLKKILYRRARTANGEYIFGGPSGEKLPKRTMDNIMPRLCMKVNTDENGNLKPEEERMKPFTLHSIRHHVAAHLFLNCGYSIAELQKILRHKRASTTDQYLKSIIDMDTTRGLNALDENNFETHDGPGVPPGVL